MCCCLAALRHLLRQGAAAGVMQLQAVKALLLHVLLSTVAQAVAAAELGMTALKPCCARQTPTISLSAMIFRCSSVSISRFSASTCSQPAASLSVLRQLHHHQQFAGVLRRNHGVSIVGGGEWAQDKAPC